MADPPAAVVAAYRDVLRIKPGVEFVRSLELALCSEVDLDVWGICGVDPSLKDEEEDVFDEAKKEADQKKASTSAAKPAAKADSKPKAEAPAKEKPAATKRRSAEEEAPEPKTAKTTPLPPGDPCDGCGTFWPVGLRYCPGKWDSTKNCKKVDPDISKEQGEKEGPPAEARAGATSKPPPWAK